jgi:hypothetical protein
MYMYVYIQIYIGEAILQPGVFCVEATPKSFLWVDLTLSPPTIESDPASDRELREKHTAEMRSHEEWRRIDHMSSLSRLALQSHLKCVPGHVSD